MIAADIAQRSLADGIPRSLASSRFDTRVTSWSSAAGAAQAGGDWCDVFAVSRSTVALTIGDVAGHGKAVAATMAAVRACVVEAIHDIRVPSDVLAVANTFASSFGAGDGVVVTGIVAILDHRLRTLTFANAGHPPPLMLTTDRHAFLARSPADFPLGIFAHYNAADYVVALPLDALVVFYTDGITEHARDPIGGERELLEATRLVHARPELNAARAIARRVFKQRRGHDDAAAIGLRTPPTGCR